jgi:hypothetical protein
MPQSPIPAQAYARAPNKSFVPVLADANGLLLVAGGSPGNSIFVNEETGADDNGGGPNDPFATLDAALAEATANNGDAVYLMGTSHRTSVLDWNKSGVSLIGLLAPSNNDRARISQTGSTHFDNLVDVTASGCRFENIATFHGFDNASAQICWNELGGRNYYKNVEFLGMGNTTAAAQAGSRSLVVGGAGENIFDDCTLGLDTVLRATGNNATLEFIAGTPRNVFNRALFQMLTSNAADVHITAGAGGLDRYAIFNDPVFMNAIESTSIAIDAAITANAAAGGAIILNRPLSLGATALATTGPVYVVGSTPVATTSGIAIKAT